LACTQSQNRDQEEDVYNYCEGKCGKLIELLLSTFSAPSQPFSSPFFALQRTNTENWKEIFPEK
jgi:hypothetical protein